MAQANITPREQELRKHANILGKIWSAFWIAMSILTATIMIVSGNWMLAIIATIFWWLSEAEVITKQQAKEANKQ